MQLEDYTYNLPEELIATRPPKQRGDTRLLVVGRSSGQTHHCRYQDFADYPKAGDVVVLNDTKVIKSRLLATNASGRQRELLLLESHGQGTLNPHHWRVIHRGKIRPHETLHVGSTPITVEDVEDGGLAVVSSPVSLLDLGEQAGNVPLPPYMHRQATATDVKRYQTIFAKSSGSVAAPTASLNFTKELITELQSNGVQVVYLTLHVGLGTFLPIRVEKIEDHVMHSEYFEIPSQTISAIRGAKSKGRKIFAIGTTVARTLEFTANWYDPASSAPPNAGTLTGEANIFIYPSYNFKVVDALLTNFHAPKTTVLMLAAAFAGWPNLQAAYQTAIQQKYAFLSYGDSMLII